MKEKEHMVSLAVRVPEDVEMAFHMEVHERGLNTGRPARDIKKDLVMELLGPLREKHRERLARRS